MKIEKEIDGRFRNMYHKAVINLIYTANQLNGVVENALAKHNISTQQYNVLRLLRGFGPDPLSIGFIKERMLDKSSDVSRIVDRLVIKKLIIRSECKTDRRQKDLRISDKGLALLTLLDPIEQEVDLLLKKLNNEEVEVLNNLLDKTRS